jgi:crossover junction endodeoxyribonuclease RuvC
VKIIGIDPGIAIVGYGVLEQRGNRLVPLDYGCIRTEAALSVPARLKRIYEAKVPVAEYTPLQVKMAVVGYGQAEKRQVQEMVRLLLSLSKIPKPDDAADALAIAICHAHSSTALSRLEGGGWV